MLFFALKTLYEHAGSRRCTFLNIGAAYELCIPMYYWHSVAKSIFLNIYWNLKFIDLIQEIVFSYWITIS